MRPRPTLAVLSAVSCLVLVMASMAPAAASADPARAVLNMTGPQWVRPGEMVSGEVTLARPVEKPTQVAVQWRDSYGRVGGRSERTLATGEDRFDYALVLASPITKRARVEAIVDGATQMQNVKFGIVQPAPVWDDFVSFVWAHYPYGGYYEKLLEYGVDGEHLGRSGGGEWVHDHNFKYYVDQLGYEVFAYYHKRRDHWDAIMNKYAEKPSNVYLRHRHNSLSDPLTFQMIDDLYAPAIKLHAPNRPLFYNLADEIGFGDQSGANDFCWDYPSRDLFRDTLIKMYSTLDNLNKQWETDYQSWGAVRAVQPTTYWQYDRMYKDIYLPRQFDAADSDEAVEAFGTPFQSFEAMVGLYGELRTSQPVDVEYVQGQVGKEIGAVNDKYGTRFDDLEDVVAFYNAFDEWSFSLKVDRDDVNDMKGWNLAPWLDFREIMDGQMATAIAKAAEIGRKYDPEGRFGFTGTHHPGVFSGHNYAKLCPLVGIVVPYNIGNTPEIVRSLNPDTCYQVLPSWKSGETGVRDIWTRALHGDRGMIFWDNDEEKNKFISRPDKEPTFRATSLGPTLVELQSGLAKQLIASRRDNNGVAIVYSHPSVRVDYWRQYMGEGRKWVDRRSWMMYRPSMRNVLRASWYRLIEDLNLQYDAVSSEQVADGRLGRDGYKVLILPEVFAMSAAEEARIRKFHADGGTVIADRFCGVMDEHGKWLDTPRLADLWAQPRAHLLNRGIDNYSYLRMTPGDEVEMRDAVGTLIAAAGVEPVLRVISTKTDKPLVAAEVHAFDAGGGVQVVGITRSIQLNQEGIGGTQQVDNSAYEKVEPVKIVPAGKRHVYNQRPGEYLGEVESASLDLDPWEATVLVLADRKIQPITATAKLDGSRAVVAVTGSPATTRAVRVEVRSPDGQLLRPYSGNILVEGGKGQWSFPLALSDANGTYAITCKDVLTGQVVELAVTWNGAEPLPVAQR